MRQLVLSIAPERSTHQPETHALHRTPLRVPGHVFEWPSRIVLLDRHSSLDLSKRANPLDDNERQRLIAIMQEMRIGFGIETGMPLTVLQDSWFWEIDSLPIRGLVLKFKKIASSGNGMMVSAHCCEQVEDVGVVFTISETCSSGRLWLNSNSKGRMVDSSSAPPAAERKSIERRAEVEPSSISRLEEVEN
jgi:hypothetical protein